MPYLTLLPAHLVAKSDHAKRSHQIAAINDPQFRHRAIMSLFPEIEGNPRTTGDILFRLETNPGQAPAFLIQSVIAPVNIPAGARSKEFTLPELHAGQPVQFRLAINGIQRLTHGGIRPVEMDEAATSGSPFTDWLGKKLGKALTDIQIITHNREVLGVDRRGNIHGEGKVVQIDTVDGFAEVADPEALSELLLHGVGRAKSYGCGLLTVKALG